MKSIRLSLLFYLLALIGLALGGVSTLVYQITGNTLLDKQVSTANLVRAQCEAQCEILSDNLDRRLFRQAWLLIHKARTRPLKYDAQGVAAAAAQAAIGSGHLVVPLWSPTFRRDTMDKVVDPAQIVGRLLWVRPFDIVIVNADEYIPEPNEVQPQEFFQTYRAGRGRGPLVLQRSQSLRDRYFTLDDEARTTAEGWQEHYDNINLDGTMVRRLTLKGSVTGSTGTGSFFRFFPPLNKTKTVASKGPAPDPANPRPKASFPPVYLPPPPSDQAAPTFFIQYASDTAHLDAEMAELRRRRDAKLAEVEGDTTLALGDLRRRLGIIALMTFLGMVTGGYLLVRLGLAPLARLSDAVSQVNEKDFRLKVDTERLPAELRPIAGRLTDTLGQLRDAFDREKQAAADISHELRTPLAALMITLDVALRKKRSTDEYREILEECQVSGRHMSHLVEQLLALAKLDAGAVPLQVEPVDVAELARQSTDMVRPLADERGLSLQCRAADPVIVNCDPHKLREIVINLLQNAVEYNRPGGSIDLCVLPLQNAVQIEVRDTGIGISPEARPHIFERFYRADPSRHADSPHCGLGLAIVKSYVDLMGGVIEVDSSPAGSMFRIRLPQGATGAQASASGKSATPAAELANV
jgi:heavy metal sensor kinase